MKKTIVVNTLGCSKNRVDSERVARQIETAGHVVLFDRELGADLKADIIVINTCGFIKDAKEESIEAIFAAVKAKKEGYVGEIVVFGCLSQRYPNDLVKGIPEVDHFLGANDLAAILKVMGIEPALNCFHERTLSTPSHYAYLKISEGCNRSCAFCAIPMIRGPYMSTPQEQLLREAEYLAAQGVKELILVAQDTTFYGWDLCKQKMLASLIKQLVQIDGIQWIRLHYAYPASFPEDVLELMANHPKVCPYLDIPLQHISTKVLTAMNRGIDERQTRALIHQIRKKVPGVILRTTLMVGFPGEDKRAFDQLLSFVAETRFERLGVFTYSEEEETCAAKRYKDTVPKQVKQDRYATLMELQSGISFAYNQSRVGQHELVLIDRVANGVLAGRSRSESPEVDGEIYVTTELPAKEMAYRVGSFQKIKICKADIYDLQGEIMNE